MTRLAGGHCMRVVSIPSERLFLRMSQAVSGCRLLPWLCRSAVALHFRHGPPVCSRAEVYELAHSLHHHTNCERPFPSRQHTRRPPALSATMNIS